MKLLRLLMSLAMRSSKQECLVRERLPFPRQAVPLHVDYFNRFSIRNRLLLEQKRNGRFLADGSLQNCSQCILSFWVEFNQIGSLAD